MSAFPPIVLQKSFCTGGQNFRGLQARFSCKDLGTSSPRAKLTGNFANAAEATRIVHRFVLRVLVKNSWRCNFRLLQHYPSESGHGQFGPDVRFVPATVIRDGAPSIAASGRQRRMEAI